MFIAIYAFHAKPGQEAAFEEAWHALTEMIYQYEGSLGSRLHRQETGPYIAYAQWPDKTTWEHSGDKLPELADRWRKQMRASCTRIETLYELEVVDDLLRTTVLNQDN